MSQGWRLENNWLENIFFLALSHFMPADYIQQASEAGSSFLELLNPAVQEGISESMPVAFDQIAVVHY